MRDDSGESLAMNLGGGRGATIRGVRRFGEKLAALPADDASEQVASRLRMLRFAFNGAAQA